MCTDTHTQKMIVKESLLSLGQKGSNRRRGEQERWRVDTAKLYDILE